MAKPGQEIDLAYRLLDLDLVDSEGRRCGKVDDLELTGEPGETVYVAGIVSGPRAIPARFPRRLRRFAARLFRGGEAHLEWKLVEEVDACVRLAEPAADLGLAEGDRKLAALAPGGEEGP